MVKKRNLKGDIPLITTLTKLKEPDFKAMINNVPDHTIDNICECVYNVIFNPSLKIGARKRNKIRNFIKKNCSANRLKTISTKKHSVFKRRKALKQEGRGLPFLLASAIPFLINLFTGK